jgi:hypothetical protein
MRPVETRCKTGRARIAKIEGANAWGVSGECCPGCQIGRSFNDDSFAGAAHYGETEFVRSESKIPIASDYERLTDALDEPA